ncbi:DUF1285 domain-containing protein [Pseudooceanicola sp.]|uniref:DUF1285 domain-containing protein n=1 Tax=Pseudooceanicola sp. TaxID=1914328 RepID=UPI0035170E31
MAKPKDGQKDVKPTAESIAASVRAASKGRGLPPIHQWNPERETDANMRIARDGTWFHEGTPINRPELVRLFSTILRKDDDGYFLITPVEKARVEVEDAPFVAVDLDVEGEGEDQRLTFLTNVGDRATAGPDHPIRVERDPGTGEPAPYVLVRDKLEALIDRKSFYRLVETGSEQERDGTRWFGLWSGGAFFPVIPASELKTH